jgi:hypothetical protein
LWSAKKPAQGSAIRDYTIEYSKNGGKTWVSVWKNPSPSKQVTLTGLAKKTTYLARVRAINDVGESYPSKPLKFRTK